MRFIMKDKQIMEGYSLAKAIYSEYGVDVDAAIHTINSIPISMNAWQGDDLLGFEGQSKLTGGICATGAYPGRARTADELRADLEQAIECIPGKMKVAIHSMHGEKNNRNIDRDNYDIDMFDNWIDWANDHQLGLDFNPTFFSHPMMDGDFSLTSSNKGKRKFWIEHGKRCREIANEIGKRTGQTCINNFWMPDGYKDVPADTLRLRELMIEALDEIFSVSYNEAYTKDSLESKLFGLGIESYTVANHEFSLLYASTHNKLYTMDAGHFHPTESVASKISSILCFTKEILLHVSRGVHWDSDHIVLWNEELQNIANEIVHNHYENRVNLALDYFDASINRIFGWVIGVRNTRKALLKSALDPITLLRNSELNADYSSRLALWEESKSLPFSLVWDYYCMTKGVPVGQSWFDKIRKYEEEVTSKR